MSLRIETARPDMAGALLAIYGPYVTGTTVTFEYEVPTEAEFAQRIAGTLARYPYLVAMWDETPVGYAYAGVFKPRAAYDWSVEVSVYVREDMHGKGVGKALYQALEAILIRQGIRNANACITSPNPQSEAFHFAMGYRTVAHFSQCGFKHGHWHDMIWMEKHLQDHMGAPAPIVPFSQLNY
ncbi:MAG: N-acetyltransferase [Clostridia bacterium]|nr:N-acetyltransferase [Clostridia bacterium]